MWTLLKWCLAEMGTATNELKSCSLKGRGFLLDASQETWSGVSCYRSEEQLSKRTHTLAPLDQFYRQLIVVLRTPCSSRPRSRLP